MFLSDYDTASDVDKLNLMSVNVVINCAFECVNKNHDNIEYFDCLMEDTIEEHLENKVNEAMKKIHQSFEQGKKVLV